MHRPRHRDRGRPRRPASPRCRPSCSRRSPPRSPASTSTTARSSRSAPTTSPTCSPRTTSRTASASCTTWCSASSCCEPIPVVVAHRVAQYAEALGVKDDFVRVARRYAQGAYGLAWMDLRAQRLRRARPGGRRRVRTRHQVTDPFALARLDPELEARWIRRSPTSRDDTLGRGVWDMYDGRGFELPGSARWRRRVPRAARLRARARRLRHQPPGRARGVRVHRARRSRSEGLRVARHAHRAVRDRLHRRHGLLRPRRVGTATPGPGHAHARRRRDPPRQGGLPSITGSTCSTSTTTSSRRSRSTRSARGSAIPPKSAAALEAGSAGLCSTVRACRRRNGGS